jgi:hypothetical protein
MKALSNYTPEEIFGLDAIDFKTLDGIRRKSFGKRTILDRKILKQYYRILEYSINNHK